MAVVDRCHRGRGRDTLLPCNLLPFFHKHMHMRSGVGPALIYPALPPHPPSSAGNPARAVHGFIELKGISDLGRI